MNLFYGFLVLFSLGSSASMRQKEVHVIYTNFSQTVNAEFLEASMAVDHSKQYISIDIIIKKALNAPYLRIVLEGYFKNRKNFKLDKTFAVCTIKKYQLTNPIVALVKRKFEELSNFKRCCPILAGKYYLHRLGITQADTPFLAAFAGINTTWNLAVTSYEKMPGIGLVNISHIVLESFFS